MGRLPNVAAQVQADDDPTLVEGEATSRAEEWAKEANKLDHRLLSPPSLARKLLDGGMRIRSTYV